MTLFLFHYFPTSSIYSLVHYINVKMHSTHNQTACLQHCQGCALTQKHAHKNTHRQVVGTQPLTGTESEHDHTFYHVECGQRWVQEKEMQNFQSKDLQADNVLLQEIHLLKTAADVLTTQCCQVGNVVLSYQRHKIIVF